ncbi:MAG: NAD-dependent epimerase/dehydratase family protein [Deltaproteobacteria bacterium]|nr:NAD-dependent epimerase/dehydratase family protein [Deltaproteobacteria bacterium]
MNEAVLILGCGFLGNVLAQQLAFKGVPVIGTARGEPQLGIIRTRGAMPLELRDVSALDRLPAKIGSVLMSIPPEAGLDQALADRIGGWGLAPGKVAYVSSTSVYGDRAGETVDETTPVAPSSPKAHERVAAEAIWRQLGAQVVRPAGIYGPGRSLLHRLASGKMRLIDGGALINRIHVADLASLCEAALARGTAGATWLGADTLPATHDEVVAWLVSELKLPEPPRMSLAEARVRMDKDTLAMFSQSKRIDSTRTFATLGVTMRYPTYREGMKAIWAREKTMILAAREAQA